jgi:hypothetical protein
MKYYVWNIYDSDNDTPKEFDSYGDATKWVLEQIGNHNIDSMLYQFRMIYGNEVVFLNNDKIN